MDTYTNMHNDIKRGKLAETRVADLLIASGYEVSWSPKGCKEHDLMVKKGRKKFTVEVKYDLMAAKTSNIAIEYHNPKSNIPSGISATKSNIWAHCIKDDDNIVVFITATAALVEWVATQTPKRIVELGGDANASLALYDMDTILDRIFIRIDDQTPTEIEKIIKRTLK